MKRAVPAVADHAGKRVARPLRHTVLILHIVPTVFRARNDFSRPDAIFRLFFRVYGLPTFPERVTDFSEGILHEIVLKATELFIIFI